MATSGARSPAVALGLVAGSQFLIILDLASINVALPGIAGDLRLTEGQVSWVVNAYTLAFGCMLLLGARLGDAFGTRRVFACGLALFGSASLGAALMSDPLGLSAARGVQGAGAALIAPNALATLSRLFPDGVARNRALAVWVAAGSAGAPAGAVVGGALTESLGWAAVLMANVPVCGAALALTPWALSASGPSLSSRSLDLAGAASVTTGLALLVYALVDASRSGWASAQTLVVLSLGGTLIGLFMLVERRVEAPLVPIATLGRSTLAGACLITAVGAMPVYGTSFAFSIYAQGVLDLRPVAAGLVFLPFGVSAMVSARGAGGLVTRFGFKPVAVVGLCLMAAGHVPLVQVGGHAEFVMRLLPALILLGSGAGLLFVATSVAGLSAASHRDAAVAAGLITTSQQIGGAVGLALAVAVLEGVRDASGNVAGVSAAFGFDLAVAACGGCLALAVLSSRKSRTHSRAARAGAAHTQA